ncbi:MAG: M23 family metallopeptidase [Candidatus Marinimicrobia bacterium]|nr:M23 family metallopeptidase [Candidatus Neomarinimicrobiota bacterium]
MKPNKYTVLLIPDNGDNNRQITLHRRVIFWGIILSCMLIVGAMSVWYYSIKVLEDHHELQNKYDTLVQDRLTVIELMDDLQRMKQMDQLIRKTLGTEINLDTEKKTMDSLRYSAEDKYHVSYIENFPSKAPIQGWLTQRISQSSIFQNENHYGIDLAVKEGEPILASAGGSVVYSGWNYEMGNLIILYHGNAYFTLYGHNQRNQVQKLESVKRGDVIALAGKTGISSGPHLHYEIWKDGEALDPLIFFPQYKEKDVSPNNE